MWTSSKQRGDAAEDEALRYLQARGLHLVRRNFKTPGRGGGEVDLIMREPDGTLVFVEVRQRASATQGGAAASIGRTKQRRIVWAARYFLLRCTFTPPCRFDALVLQGRLGDPSCALTWIRGAFDASVA